MKIIPALALLVSFQVLLTARAVDYSRIAAELEPVVQEEMREWSIGGVAIALVDDQQLVYSKAFGEANRESLFRVGSISKLFNATAVMQQVEAGNLDLDAPLPDDLVPINPFPGSPDVTLRQLLSHRSGVPRESPVGGYMDDSQPGLSATVSSVPGCVLVTVPGEKMRYSNIGPSIAGTMVERASGMNFEEYQRQRILGPLGMKHSAWTLKRADRKRIVVSHMRVADAKGKFSRRITPLFDLGTIPAGNLFASADELGLFAAALLANDGTLLKPETLVEMWKPQLTEEKTGFGLGFVAGKFRDHRTISHNGAVYGYSSSFVLLPEAKIAVIVLGNEDIVNGRISRISSHAIGLMLQAKVGEKPAEKQTPFAATAAELETFSGEYESQSYWARLWVEDGRLAGDISGQPTRFTARDKLKFLADSRLENATPASFARDESGRITGFTLGAQRFERVPEKRPVLPREWRRYLGSYGPGFIPIVISERFGHLYAMTENMVDYRLTPMNRNVCALPPGMYVDEEVVFLTNPNGRVHSINFASMNFRRN